MIGPGLPSYFIIFFRTMDPEWSNENNVTKSCGEEDRRKGKYRFKERTAKVKEAGSGSGMLEGPWVRTQGLLS